MPGRPTTGKRSATSGSFQKRKVAPATPTVYVHSFRDDDQKVVVPKNFKQDKLSAGLHAVENRDYVEAVKQFNLIKPDTTTSLYYSGCARLELKHYVQTQEAIVDFTKCMELSSQTKEPSFALELWYKRGLAFYYINKYDDAIKDFSECIHRCRPLREQGKEDLHRALIGRGLTYQAMYELDMAMKDMNEANKITNESNPYYLCCRAGVYAAKHEPENATKDLESATDNDCDQDVEALTQRAIVLAELGRHNAALEDLHKARKLGNKRSEEAEIYYRLGLSNYALNSKEEAFQWFCRSTNFHSFHAPAHYHLGKMQAEKGQYKDALKTLNRAHELSPEQGDILLERAAVNEQLGKPDDAAQDRRQGMQLNSSPVTIITKLADRIKKLREESDRTGGSARNHLELAMAYDGLINQKKHIAAKVEYYREAVNEYHVAIETDTKHLHPQAYALLALCHKKMNDLNEAHEIHLDFYNVFTEHKGAEYHWKAYLLEVKDKMELHKLEPHLDEAAVSKLLHMEINRRKKNVDEETFRNDRKDKYKNQLKFYQQLRIDLTNVLAAIAVLNLDNQSIINNAEDTTNRVGKIVELISKDEASVPDIISVLNHDNKVKTKLLRKTDYELVRMKIKAIGNVGDMTDQLDVAQLVARHLCTRYRPQLMCLKTNNETFDDDEDDDSVEEKPSSRPWWKCCGSGGWLSSKKTISSDGNIILEKLSTFAIAFIIHAINTETISVSSHGKSARKDALATTLVLVVNRAHLNVDTGVLSSLRYGKEKLPINIKAVTKMLEDLRRPHTDELPSPIEWELYEFFRAPGIYYYSDNDTGNIRYYGSHSSMMSHLYGYRLGTKEEVNVFRKLNLKEE